MERAFAVHLGLVAHSHVVTGPGGLGLAGRTVLHARGAELEAEKRVAEA